MNIPRIIIQRLVQNLRRLYLGCKVLNTHYQVSDQLTIMDHVGLEVQVEHARMEKIKACSETFQTEYLHDDAVEMGKGSSGLSKMIISMHHRLQINMFSTIKLQT